MAYAHGVKWDNELVEKEIKRVMECLEIKRMPSLTEIKSVTNDYALTNRISRSGGFNYWADKLNLEMKRSETGLAKRFESVVARKLVEIGYDVKRMSTKHPYDLLINGTVKIDVKVANLFESESGACYHTFNLEKKHPTCDIYVAIALDDKDIDRIFIIPSKFLNITQLSVGSKSMYNNYIERWDYIEQYAVFYNSVI